MDIEKGSFFQCLHPYNGVDNTSKAFIVPGTTTGSGGEIRPTPPPRNSSTAHKKSVSVLSFWVEEDYEETNSCCCQFYASAIAAYIVVYFHNTADCVRISNSLFTSVSISIAPASVLRTSVIEKTAVIAKIADIVHFVFRTSLIHGLPRIFR